MKTKYEGFMLTNVSGDSVSLHSYEDLGRFVIFKNTILKYIHTKKSNYSKNKELLSDFKLFH